MPIIKKSLPKREAIEMFREHKMYDKVNLFHYRRSSRVNIYMLEDTIDYFYGYMASNTSYIRYFDLYLYDDGFVLQMPEPSAPEKVDAFEPPEKLFNVLKQSARNATVCWWFPMKWNPMNIYLKRILQKLRQH